VKMDRNMFLKSCGVACVSGAAITALLEGCTSANYYAKTLIAGNKIVIPKTEFEYVDDGQKINRQFVLVRSAKNKYPICVHNNSTGQSIGDYNTAEKITAEQKFADHKSAELSTANTPYTALLMECTHKGCELRVNGEYLVCPCHGSEFTNKGVVQNPPAEKNLRTFIVTADNENIYVEV